LYVPGIGNERLTREILDLMIRLEKIAQVPLCRRPGHAQQDVIRAQVEQTTMRNETDRAGKPSAIICMPA
jgi:hypothetical protein